jgi:glycosyltransferase involved in cell wall biosynthesis
MSVDIIILTKNEQANLPDCLASFKGLGRAVVIDDNSNDETVKVAREAGATVYERIMDNFSGQRNFGLEKAEADWVFFLDADERFDPELMEAVRGHVAGPKNEAGRVLRRNYAFGRRFRFGHLAPDQVTRLFPRGAVRWSGEVHENPETGLPVKTLPGYLEHHTYRDWEQFLGKMERYARMWAHGAARRGVSVGVAWALGKATFNIFKTLVLKLGILEGPCGWAVSAVIGYYTLSKYLILNGLTGKDLNQGD